LYEDVDGVVTKLNAKLEETIRSYMETSEGEDQAKSMDAGSTATHVKQEAGTCGTSPKKMCTETGVDGKLILENVA